MDWDISHSGFWTVQNNYLHQKSEESGIEEERNQNIEMELENILS